MPADPPVDVRLLALSTALPPNILYQTEVIAASRAILGPRFKQFDRLAQAFENAGIEKRHSVVPMDWFGHEHGWVDRTQAYLQGALELFAQAATTALDRAGLSADQVDVIVTVSSTGIATPTLEAQLASRLGFRADVMRLPVFGLGCAGGVSGLAIARDLAAARPRAVVLLVAVETCTILFRMDRLSKADIIATALFGDGAAAAILRSADPTDHASPSLGIGIQHIWPDSLNIMGWRVEENGLGVIFDRSIPSFVETELRPVLDRLLPASSFDRYVCHPGGAKVITALETALALPEGRLDAERKVLERAGNMSAPTALFVLDDVLRAGQGGDLLLMALGPGFTLSLLPLYVGESDG